MKKDKIITTPAVSLAVAMIKLTVMTHVKNAADYSRLVDSCTGLGGIFNPGRQTLQIEALVAKKKDVTNVLNKVISAKSLYDNEVNQRKQVFDQLPKLVSSILRMLEASGASPEKLNDARSFARQINGSGSKKSVSTHGPGQAQTQPEPAKVRHSTLQLAYTSKADSFARLVNAIATEPLYLTNEATLSVASLNDKLSELNKANESVSAVRVVWSNAMIDRNDVMYHQPQSMCNTGRAVKKYVRAIFGPGSEQFGQVKNLRFTKPIK